MLCVFRKACSSILGPHRANGLDRSRQVITNSRKQRENPAQLSRACRRAPTTAPLRLRMSVINSQVQGMRGKAGSSALQIFVQGTLFVWLASYLNRYWGMPVSEAATLAAGLVLVSGLGQLICGVMTDRISGDSSLKRWNIAIGHWPLAIGYWRLPRVRRSAGDRVPFAAGQSATRVPCARDVFPCQLVRHM